MKIRDKNKKLLLLTACVVLIWVAYEPVHSFLVTHRMLLHPLNYDLSVYELDFRALFVAGMAVFGILVLLFGTLANNILASYHRNEEQIRDLVNLSNDIITITDRDGKLKFMNDAACRILECKREDAIGKPFMEFVHPEDRKKYLGKREELGKLRTDTFIVENRFMTKSGKPINVLHTVRVLTENKGELVGTLGIARDILKSSGRKSHCIRLLHE
jgi:PAS domain S-box-containing protein